MDKLKQFRGQLPANLSTLDQVRAATAGKSQAEVAAAARRAIEGMDKQKLADFGQLMQESLARKGIKPPPGVSQGSVNEIASLMGNLLTGQNPESYRAVFTNPAVQDSARGVVMAKLLTSRFGLLAMLLRDPRGAAVVGPILKSLVRMR